MKHDYYDHAFLHFLFADYKEIETTRTGEHFLPLSKKIIWIGLIHTRTAALNHLVVSNNVQKPDLFSRKRRGQLSSHFLLRPCDETLPKQLGPEAKREKYHTRLALLCCFRRKRTNRQIIEPFSSSPVIKFSRPACCCCRCR